MNRRKERLVDESKKIVENINEMTFANLNDQQVHSLMTMREIARGIVNNRVEKVTKSDVKKALSFSIEKMVGSCKDVSNILSRIPCDGMDDEQTQSVSRMKEIVSMIVTRRAKVSTTRREPVESVSGVDAETVESKMGEALIPTNRDIGGLQRRLFENEALEVGAQARNKDSQNESMPSGNGAVPLIGEQVVMHVDGSETTSNEMQIGQVEGMMFDDVQLVVEIDDLRTEDGQNDLMEIDELRAQDGNYEMAEADRLRIENSQNEMMEVGDLRIVDGHIEMVEADELRGEDGRSEMVESVELRTDEMEADGLRTDDQNNVQKNFSETSEPKNTDNQNKVSLSPFRGPVVWPPGGKITLDWVKNLMFSFERSSKRDPPSEFWSLMPLAVVDKLLNAASSILSKEPNCVAVDCQGEDSRVAVVGDVNGQFHDLLNIFKIVGLPSEKQFYVFNGNYVDRGAWGLEVFLVLLAWKVLMPNRVYLLRGNHETKFSTSIYGFEQEVKTKFGDQGEMVYKNCVECFKDLPLASIIAGCVYTTHGGLFRSTHTGPFRRTKRKRAHNVELGSLEDLSKVNRLLIDAPDGGPNVLLGDVLWSNPSMDDGLFESVNQGMGLSWGPDCTEAFLKQSNLKLILRSHEGPDARAGQDDFGDMLSGYSMDHHGESGTLYTLFSAPDYPQFGETKYYNEGAFAILKPPNFERPSFHSFKAVERPEVHGQPTTDRSSSSRSIFPPWISSKVDFEALGISNPPSWSVPLADDAGGVQVVPIPRAPMVEGLPLPSDLQEPHKAAFEYLFELIAALKHIISARVTENGVQKSAEGCVPNGGEVNVNQAKKRGAPYESQEQMNEVNLKQAEEGSTQVESQDQNNEVSLKQAEKGSIPDESQGQNYEVSLKHFEKGSAPDESQGQNYEISLKQSKKGSALDESQGQNYEASLKRAVEVSTPYESQVQYNEVNLMQVEERSTPYESQGKNNDANLKQAGERITQDESQGQNYDVNLKQPLKKSTPDESQEQNNEVKAVEEKSNTDECLKQNNDVNLIQAVEEGTPCASQAQRNEADLMQVEEESSRDKRQGQINEVNSVREIEASILGDNLMQVEEEGTQDKSQGQSKSQGLNNEANSMLIKEGNTQDERQEQNNEDHLKQTEEESTPVERQGPNNKDHLKQTEEESTPVERQGQNNEDHLKQTEEESNPVERQGQNNENHLKQTEEESTQVERQGQNNEDHFKQTEEESTPVERQGQTTSSS
uniref:Serine/threonine-protein phosphatase n=1 Tax=Cannabis sativa TaxID=3483 RepID=A0A803NY55_CANSA